MIDGEGDAHVALAQAAFGGGRGALAGGGLRERLGSGLFGDGVGRGYGLSGVCGSWRPAAFLGNEGARGVVREEGVAVGGAGDFDFGDAGWVGEVGG